MEKCCKENKKLSKTFEFTSICQKCGKEFTLSTTQALINRNKHRKFCCIKCANSRTKSDEVKEKISKSLSLYFSSLGKNRKANNYEECKNCSVRHPNNRSKDILVHNCIYCGKEIRAKYIHNVYCYECAGKLGLSNLQLWDENGKKIASNKRRESSRMVQNKLVAEGRHKGWQSRNISSYPENFWKLVLDNNLIDYKHNYAVSKKSLGIEGDSSCYFLDFLLDGKIDLEIDGKQHSYYDRKKSDKQRDEVLKRNGYIVYRVPWNEITTTRGSMLMKQKIDNFLKFLDSQRKPMQDVSVSTRFQRPKENVGQGRMRERRTARSSILGLKPLP